DGLPGANSVSPRYTAVMLSCLPTASADVANDATPLAFRFADPSSVPLSKKSTAPVGVLPPPPVSVTVARNVAASPNTVGLCTDTSSTLVKLVRVGTGLTVWLSGPDAARAKVGLPL